MANAAYANPHFAAASTRKAKSAPDTQPISLQQLRQVTQEHLTWLNSGGRDGRRANLSHANLTGMNLQGLFLPEANLRSAVLTGANLQGANFQGADFSEAMIEHTNLRQARLEGANFSRCVARSAYFDKAQMIDCNFSAAVVEGASFAGANLSGVRLREATLHRANFSGAQLSHAIMRHATAFETVFEGADLSFADCRDAQFTFTRFKDAVLREAGMRGAQFEHVQFSEADFSTALDMDSRYAAQSLESEKQNIASELENMAKKTEELLELEQRVNDQKRDVLLRRRSLDSLNELEAELSQDMISYMKRFRLISSFWFVVVAMFATVLIYKIGQIGIQNLNLLEVGVVSTVMLTVLGAHVFSATYSYHIARQFARYVRLRREKLAAVDMGQTAMPAGARMVQSPALSAAQHEGTMVY